MGIISRVSLVDARLVRQRRPDLARWITAVQTTGSLYPSDTSELRWVSTKNNHQRGTALNLRPVRRHGDAPADAPY